MGSGMVENIAQPDHQVGLLGQGEADGRLERPLEVPLPLVNPALHRVGQVGTAEMSVADGGDLHAERPGLILTSTARSGDHYAELVGESLACGAGRSLPGQFGSKMS